MKLVILDGYTENPGDLSWDWLGELVEEYKVYDKTETDDVLQRCEGADIVVTNKVPLPSSIIEKLPNLKFISTLSTGYNVVDCDFAREKGIPVSNIPAYSTTGVTQSVFALLFELCNQVGLHSNCVMAGEWTTSEHFCFWKTPLSEIAGKTFGIIGLGKIGTHVAKVALAFGMKVLVYTPNTRHFDGEGDVSFVSMDEVLKNSDAISLHCPLTDDTDKLVNKDFIAKMKKSAYLINTSRGQVIDETDLAAALENGDLAGFGADVLSTEPPMPNNPLLGAKNCFITPHIAWASYESRIRLMNTFKGNIEGFVKNEPVNLVN
ncbi:MAG: D-2-hydroxyacid dehydrogenase [Clostridia bacterium]